MDTTCHWKEGAVFCLAGMNTRCFKNSNLWFGKVCFFSSTQDILYGVLGGKTNDFFFLSKKAFMMGIQ